MQDILIEQLTEMQNTLSQNISSIKSLIDASKALGDLIDKLLDNPPDQETLQSLMKTREDIGNTISDLIRQTDSLFDTYRKIVDNI